MPEVEIDPDDEFHARESATMTCVQIELEGAEPSGCCADLAKIEVPSLQVR